MALWRAPGPSLGALNPCCDTGLLSRRAQTMLPYLSGAQCAWGIESETQVFWLGKEALLLNLLARHCFRPVLSAVDSAVVG